MAWRCVAKKADGSKCKCAVSARGGRCAHHKRSKKATRKKTRKTRKKATRKKTRKKTARKRRCKAIIVGGRRCKCYCKPGGVYCATHKGGKKRKVSSTTRRRRRNPLAPFGQLEDRWSLPRLPKNTIA